MQAQGTELLRVFQNSDTPAIVIDLATNILWQNAAARPFTDPSMWKILWTPDRIAALKQGLRLQVMSLSAIQHALFTHKVIDLIDVSGADPNDAYYLLRIRVSRSQNQQMELQTWALSSAAHDMKNPIGAIYSYADTLLHSNAEFKLEGNSKLIVQKIRVLANRSLELIRNYQALTTFSLRTPGSLIEKTDLNHAVISAVEQICPGEIEQKRTKLELHNGPIPISIRNLYVERIVANLCANALRYSPELSTVRVITELTDKIAILRVHNIGVPIPPHEQHSIFERGVRGSGAASTSGSGLGLYLVKTITEAYGGTVSVTSDEVSGTEFLISFKLS
jgi:signal transduction histidine kinase